jgi:hypothetical protein
MLLPGSAVLVPVSTLKSRTVQLQFVVESLEAITEGNGFWIEIELYAAWP